MLVQRRLVIFKKKKKEKNVEPEQGDATADDAVKAEDSEATGSGKKDASKIDLKNLLVMIVVAVMSVGCAFIFVTRFHSSKDVYDTTKSSVASAAGSSSDSTESGAEDGKNSGTEKDGEAEKVKSKDKKKDKKKGKKGNDEKKEKSNSVLGKILVPMDSIVVNIGKVDSKRYLRVIISLEVKSSEIEGTIKSNKVVFRDKLVSFLSSKSLSEISDRTNHQGLRTEIKDIFNNTLLGSDDAISQVYFSDFIIQ